MTDAEGSDGVPATWERGLYVSANKCSAPVNYRLTPTSTLA